MRILSCGNILFWVILFSGCSSPSLFETVPIELDLAHSIGDFTVKYPDLNRKDTTNARLVRFRAKLLSPEPEDVEWLQVNAGMEIEGVLKDKDLFQDEQETAVGFKSVNYMLTGEFLFHPYQSFFEAPWKFGILLGGSKHKETGNGIKYFNRMLLTSLEPSVNLQVGKDKKFSLFAKGLMGKGVADIEVPRHLSETGIKPCVKTSLFEHELGVRFRYDQVFCSVSRLNKYMRYRDYHKEKIDPYTNELKIFDTPEIITKFDGVLFSVGVLF